MASLVVCGAINWDTSCFVEHLPVPGEEVTVSRVNRVSGGTGGNVAVAAARLLGPGEVALIGALGEDDLAERQIAALKAEGVLTGGIRHIPGEESGQAYILVDASGQNVIASRLGANAGLTAEHLNSREVGEQLDGCRCLVLTDPPLDLAAELVALAGSRDIPVLWDPGILINPHRDALRSLAREAALLFLNETEAAALLGAGGVEAGLRALTDLDYRNRVVFKLGARGAAMVEPGAGTVVEAPALPLGELGLSVVNTVGCGDVFAGAFAACRVLGMSWRDCLLMAGAAAGLNATRPETRGGPDRAELDRAVRLSREAGFATVERPASQDG